MEQEPCSISILLSRRDNSFLKLLRGMKGRGSILKFGLDEKKEKKEGIVFPWIRIPSTIEFPRGDAERSASKSLHARKKRNGFLRTESRDNRPRMTPIYSPPEIYRRKLLRTSWELVGELDEILETNCLLLARLFDKTCGNSRYRRISDDDLSFRTKIAKRNCICLYLNIFLSANRRKIFKLRNFTSYHL